MDKKGKIAIIGALFLVSLLFIGLAIAKPGVRAVAECKDGIDNDNDGYTDYPADPGCSSRNDKSELNPEIECDDGSDNDGDNAIDMNDAGCSSPTDNDETNCGDNVCEGGEDCDNCAADCLDTGEVCCDGVAYTGDCCDDNDCTEPETCVNHNCRIPDSCSDTDSGFIVDVKGTVSGYYWEYPYSYDDYCVDSSILVEFICSGSSPSAYNTTCAAWNYTSCLNGACI